MLRQAKQLRNAVFCINQNWSNSDNALDEWFSFKCSEGDRISGPMLIEKAKDLSVDGNDLDLCFSDGWLGCFKMWHGIRRLNVSGEKQCVDHEVTERYCVCF